MIEGLVEVFLQGTPEEIEEIKIWLSQQGKDDIDMIKRLVQAAYDKRLKEAEG